MEYNHSFTYFLGCLETHETHMARVRRWWDHDKGRILRKIFMHRFIKLPARFVYLSKALASGWGFLYRVPTNRVRGGKMSHRYGCLFTRIEENTHSHWNSWLTKFYIYFMNVLKKLGFRLLHYYRTTTWASRACTSHMIRVRCSFCTVTQFASQWYATRVVFRTATLRSACRLVVYSEHDTGLQMCGTYHAHTRRTIWTDSSGAPRRYASQEHVTR